MISNDFIYEFTLYNYIYVEYILIVYLYDFEIFNQITEESLEVLLIVNTACETTTVVSFQYYSKWEGVNNNNSSLINQNQSFNKYFSKWLPFNLAF